MAKKKQLFSDLKEAIARVILNCYSGVHDYNPDDMLVHKDDLYILQQEYNIHFVEPDENQLDCITK